MVGNLLVFGFLLVALLTALALYSNWISLKFISVTTLFIWASASFFVMNNYAGWPTSENAPRSEIVSVEVREPTDTEEGKIFVWVYHVNVLHKYFFEYNPENVPRVYQIPYTKDSNKAFKRTKELLEKGYVVYFGGENTKSDGDMTETKLPGDGTDPGDGDLLIPYEKDRPKIEALNPRKMLNKN
jgi:hypothetical protein